ncbi:unnamed protein product [Scytosiphon promiscuus]
MCASIYVLLLCVLLFSLTGGCTHSGGPCLSHDCRRCLRSQLYSHARSVAASHVYLRRPVNIPAHPSASPETLQNADAAPRRFPAPPRPHRSMRARCCRLGHAPVGHNFPLCCFFDGTTINSKKAPPGK